MNRSYYEVPFSCSRIIQGSQAVKMPDVTGKNGQMLPAVLPLLLEVSSY